MHSWEYNHSSYPNVAAADDYFYNYDSNSHQWELQVIIIWQNLQRVQLLLKQQSQQRLRTNPYYNRDYDDDG